MLEWLKKWGTLSVAGGRLTKKTLSALSLTTHASLEIAEYCLTELEAKYVLLGKFQTDSLEARFGQYRQLAGGKYVSIRQVFECEKKIRLLPILMVKLQGQKINLTDFNSNLADFEDDLSNHDFPVLISDEDWLSAYDCLPVITYIAGYCCDAINRKLKCEECGNQMTSASGDINNSQVVKLTCGSVCL